LHALIIAERPLVCGVSRRLRSTTVHWRAVLTARWLREHGQAP
jgi:hypothetical protein